jgi:thiol:disulfide interchange protein
LPTKERGIVQHIETLEDHPEPVSQANPLGRLMVFAVLVGIMLVGWRYFGPKHALANGGWVFDWDQAVQQSKQTGKPALVLFTADWCPSCREFESEVLSDKQVQQYLRDNYTQVVVDVTDRTGPNTARATEFGVRSVPMLILYDKSGKERARSNGMMADDLIAWLKVNSKAAGGALY